MIKNLILTIGAITALNTPRQQANPNTIQREFLQQWEQVDSYTNNADQTTYVYYLEEKQIHQTYSLDIEAICTSTKINNNYGISFYYKFTLKNDLPNTQATLENSFTLTGDTAIPTIQVERIEYTNLNSEDDINFDINYLKTNKLNTLRPQDITSYTDDNLNWYNTNYSNFNEQETDSLTISLEPQDNTIVRKMYFYELNGNGTNFNARPENTALNYYIYEQVHEVIDLPGLLFYILTMPFSFISQAFNLTLFPNTPYVVNIANLLFALITAGIIIIIIRKVLK